MTPRKIKLEAQDELLIEWDDGHESVIPLKSLRDRCPCAGCQGETVLLKSYLPVLQPEQPGKYKLVGVEQVGSYAVGVRWADGHRTGIYTYERLRSLCECNVCRGN
jgi:DUF971 family protein